MNYNRSITTQRTPTCQDALNLCKLPLLVAEGAGAACLEPALDAVQVEHVATHTPRDAQARVVRVTWVSVGG